MEILTGWNNSDLNPATAKVQLGDLRGGRGKPRLGRLLADVEFRGKRRQAAALQDARRDERDDVSKRGDGGLKTAATKPFAAARASDDSTGRWAFVRLGAWRHT